jgi:oligoendopeptidase F
MTIPARSDIDPKDRWDLSSLYPDTAAWEADLPLLQAAARRIESCRGTLAAGPAALRACFDLLNEAGLLDERLGYYAMLRLSEDGGDSASQARQARYIQAATDLEAAASFFRPELIALDQPAIDRLMAAPELVDFRIALEKILRFKPHTLSVAEERILAMQEEANQTASRSYRALTDVDLDFGTVETPEGPVALSQSSFGALQMHADRTVRQASWERFYTVIGQHRNTLASLYSGSVSLDAFRAKVRGFGNSLEAALFPDKVDLAVYESLIAAVRRALPSLHAYYRLRARRLGLEKLAPWDTKVSLVPEVRTRHSWDEAVRLVLDALAPLGKEYVETLGRGLATGWADRYENKGKRSGAFSAGSFAGEPYILMNYKDTVLRDVFTLAHEAGHSMHSWHSVRNNPFQHYDYSIFEAEVASTFNEQLLFKAMMDASADRTMRAYLVNKQIDDIIATLFRQTMFAEFELKAHELHEGGAGATLENLTGLYRQLLADYFGPDVELPDDAALEGLRIPHFYNAFYVYKYATGLAASLALSEQVLAGKPGALERYLGFLKSGGSSYPIENLAKAGVDLSTPAPVEAALAQFAAMVAGLEGLLA